MVRAASDTEFGTRTAKAGALGDPAARAASDISRDLAGQLGIEVVQSLAGRAADALFVERVPISFARQFGLMALHSPGDPRLSVATHCLTHFQPLQIVSRLLDRPIAPLLAPLPEIISAINAAYGQQTGQTRTLLEKLERRDVLAEVNQLGAREDLLDVASRAPVIKLVNLVLSEAVQAGASDVHVQPYERSLVVRLRIDGQLHDSFELPKPLQEEIISRIKVMGHMNIAEKRLPQDGRATVQAGDRNIDLRISTIPTTFGERAVIRLLDQSGGQFAIAQLGMEAPMLERFNRLITAEHGIVLATGPTGSGKTTTLYAALREIDSARRNILTLEDPVEYRLAGISQTQISDKKGMTFASGLRSVLRQDPDIIMVGEIRDRETAVMAIQSALTGHLVFSTLHTNDAASAVARLLDLGIEPYLLASSLIGVLAQRLVRRVCPDCQGEKRAAGSTSCPTCRGTGYRGRLGIFELLTVDNDIRQQITLRAAAPDIKAVAARNGMPSLRDDGLSKVAKNLTTLAEVLRVTMGDE